MIVGIIKVYLKVILMIPWWSLRVNGAVVRFTARSDATIFQIITLPLALPLLTISTFSRVFDHFNTQFIQLLWILFRQYTRRNESLIVDTFQGQLQSKVSPWTLVIISLSNMGLPLISRPWWNKDTKTPTDKIMINVNTNSISSI